MQLLFWARNLSANRLCYIGLSFIWYNHSTYHHESLSFHQIFVSSTMGLSTLLLLVIFTANEDIIGLLEVAFEQCKVIAVTSLQFNHFLTASTGFLHLIPLNLNCVNYYFLCSIISSLRFACVLTSLSVMNTVLNHDI